MRISTITAHFDADIETVWNVVTDNEDTAWRSDLSRTEVTDDGNKFTEYTKKGFPTYFTITEKRPCRLYMFQLENNNITGSWKGTFRKGLAGGTDITFTEQLIVKNPVLGLLSRFFLNLQKIQHTYVNDLKKKLGEA